MAWRPHNFATVNVHNLSAWGKCDRCDLVYPLNELVWQYDWRGNQVQNIKLRVCTRTCVDKPYEGWRPLKLPADPIPVKDPRPINAASQEQNVPLPTLWDEPGILWDDGQTDFL